MWTSGFTIVEAISQGFISIVAPTTNEYSSNWTLSMKSVNFTDVGVLKVNVQAKL
jgi:hypothetical protein